jgi:NIMA-interacting peptidyl-prolyl cis-trans isomerase 1
MGTIAASLAACGGSIEPGRSAPTGAASASPAEACLETATATRPSPKADSLPITVRHVLVKHSGARNPDPASSRTREQACLRAMQARDAVLGGLAFDDAVARFSDEPGAASRGGLVGEVRPAELHPSVAAAAFELERGQMSDVVESPSGFHLVLRSD